MEREGRDGGTYRSGAIFWSLRSRVVKTIRARVINAKDIAGRWASLIEEPGLTYPEDADMMYAFVLTFDATKPYEAFKRGAVKYWAANWVAGRMPDAVSDHDFITKMKQVPDMRLKFSPVPAILRYLVSPAALGESMKAHMDHVVRDCWSTAKRMANNAFDDPEAGPAVGASTQLNASTPMDQPQDLGAYIKAGQAGSPSGYSWMAKCAPNMAEHLMEENDDLYERTGVNLMSLRYATFEALYKAITAAGVDSGEITDAFHS